MILAKDFEEFIFLLNKHNVEYMIVGGYALAFHGRPRHTGDLDVWINSSKENAERLLDVFSEFGIASLGVGIEDFLKLNFITQIGFPPLRIDILNNVDGLVFPVAKDNMQEIEVNGVIIKYIGYDDFITNKLASGRKQDLADIDALRRNPKK